MTGQELEAAALGYILWAAFFMLLFSSRLYYGLFCLVVAVTVGVSSLEWAPALWLPFELVFGGYQFWSDVKKSTFKGER